MKNNSNKSKPLAVGLRYGFMTLLFSHLPILLICLIQWAKESVFPSFDIIFNSGGIISIWIPVMAMLLFSFYEVREYRILPGWERLAFLLLVLLLITSTAWYMCFFFNWLSYANWVRWVSLFIIIFLFILLVFSKFLEGSAPVNLPESRLNDQNLLNDKLSKMIKK